MMVNPTAVRGGLKGATERSDFCRDRYFTHKRIANVLEERCKHASATDSVRAALKAHEAVRDHYMIAADAFQLAAYGATVGPRSEAIEYYSRGHLAASEAYSASVLAEQLYPSEERSHLSSASKRSQLIDGFHPPVLAGDLVRGAHWIGDVRHDFKGKNWVYTGRDGVDLLTGQKCWEYASIAQGVERYLLVAENGSAWEGSLPTDDSDGG